MIGWILGTIGAALVAVWLVDRLLCRFYGWQDRIRNRRVLAQAVQDAEYVAAQAWQDWDGQEVNA